MIAAEREGIDRVIAAGGDGTLNMVLQGLVGTGLSVAITDSLTHRSKRRWGALAYGVAAFRALARARAFKADITWPGGRHRSRPVQVVVGNGRYYGSALPVADDATIDDARLDLYSLEVRHLWELLVLLPSIRRGRQGEKGSVEALRATEFEISTSMPMEINVDGEICTRTPARLRVVPGALEVFV
jgi:diacylglycerol kinase family enzyme